MFELRENGNLKYYIIPSFEETGLTKHCFTTKFGGVSKGTFSSMNLRFNCEDKEENILKNFKIISKAIGVEYSSLVLSKQIHEDMVYAVSENDRGNGILFKNRPESADALVTDKRNVTLVVFSADCVPLFFLDKKRGVIALAHSGWRGTVKRIGQKTAEKMIMDYNCNPEDILVAIGPSLQEDHFEVGNEVAEKFIKEFGTHTAIKYGEKYHVNMQKAIMCQLIDAGIKKEHIDDSGICTVCNSDMLFSNRVLGNKRGHMGAFLALK